MRKIDSGNITDDKKIGYKFCNVCRILLKVNIRANHCDECNVCIEGSRL
jgi:hypothetical protein